MMRKLPWILLGLSIVFNFAFTGGMLQARWNWQEQAAANAEPTAPATQAAATPAPGPAAKAVAERLNLTADQRKAFEALRGEFRGKVERLRESLALAHEEQREELAAGASDPDRLHAMQDHIIDLQGELRAVASDHAAQFVRLLTPQQRRVWGAMVRSREPVARGLPGIRRRFDPNGDGRLSEQERAAARQGIQARPAGSGTGAAGGQGIGQGIGQGAFRQHMLRLFDKDGDGKLNEEERAAARRAWLQFQAAGGGQGTGQADSRPQR